MRTLFGSSLTLRGCYARVLGPPEQLSAREVAYDVQHPLCGDRPGRPLGHVLDLAEGGVGERSQVLGAGPCLDERRLAGLAQRGRRVADRERHALDLEPVADLLGQPAEQGAGRVQVAARDRQRVPGLEPGTPALVVVGRPDAEVGRRDDQVVGRAGGRRDDRSAGRLRTRERLGHPGRPVDGRDPDDGGVGDGGGRPVAGDGDGARHAGKRTRQTRTFSAEKISSVALDRLSV